MGRLVHIRQSEEERQAIREGLAEYESELYWKYNSIPEKVAPKQPTYHTAIPDEEKIAQLRHKLGLDVEEEPIIEVFNRAGTALLFLVIFLLFVTIGSQLAKFMGWM